MPALARANGDPVRHLIDRILAAYSKNLVVQESVRRQLKEVRVRLEGEAPRPLERLPAERAAVCWLQVARYEAVYESSSGLSISQADYHQRRIDAAHRRFLSSVRILAQVRKLAVPAIQVNIAEKQLNVSGGGS